LWDRIRRRLCRLQDHILAHLLEARAAGARGFARMSAVTASDTIYRVDRISEAAVEAWLERFWPADWPVEIVMEGRDPGQTFPRGLPLEKTRYKLILDPIDGTRNLMYDKRSAWTLAGLAPQRGGRTDLGDITVAAMTELPTSKQERADQFSVVRGGGRSGIVAQSIDLRAGGRRRRLRVRPSSATDCQGGFASIVRFFPEGKALLAKFEEELWRRLYGQAGQASPLVFEDQYISTGGQLHELLVGRDRLIADLRPLAYRRLGLARPLVCHPYDISTALILQEAGGLVETPEGRRLSAPLDAISPVSWVGYANPVLARKIRPVLRRLVREML
jgi:fructose-1,6-bisphosphatase/inositol monophosphatase family enzyme